MTSMTNASSAAASRVTRSARLPLVDDFAVLGGSL
jgi:hypothetical protein